MLLVAVVEGSCRPEQETGGGGGNCWRQAEVQTQFVMRKRRTPSNILLQHASRRRIAQAAGAF